MIGTFTTEAQADEDDERGEAPFHERLRIAAAPIQFAPGPGLPLGFTRSRFVYVERARLARLHRPDAQIVFQLTTAATGIRLEPWTLANPSAFLAAHSSEGLRAALTPDDLRKTDGCELLVARTDAGFTGSTKGTACAALSFDASPVAVSLVVTKDGWTMDERGVAGGGSDRWAPPGGVPYRYQRGSALDNARTRP